MAWHARWTIVGGLMVGCGQPSGTGDNPGGASSTVSPSLTSGVSVAPASPEPAVVVSPGGSTTAPTAPSGNPTTPVGPGAPSVSPDPTTSPSPTATPTQTSPTDTPTSSPSESNPTSAPPSPELLPGGFCYFPSSYAQADVAAAYDDWKKTVVTSSGAGGFLRVRKPDSGSVIDSTVSEGIGYGMLLAVYMNDPEVFDGLWKYARLHFNANGLMDWEIHPDGNQVIGAGAATDGDEDMAWALIMASRKWGGQGTLDDTYANEATTLINAIWEHEIDHSRGEMVKAGDAWGDVDITNPSYYAPAYYRVFGKFVGKESDWNKAVDSSYRIIEASLSAGRGNATNGLVPAWCNSQGVPTEAYGGAPLHFQNDSTRTPFRVGQDYCYFGEPRAKAYMEKITSFYLQVGVSNIVDGYNLDGSPHPEHSDGTSLPASFVGPAAVGATYSADNLAFVDEAYAALATLKLEAGTIYYQKSWTALSLLMLNGGFIEL